MSLCQVELEKLAEKLKKAEKEKRDIEQMNDYLENSVRALEFTKQDLEEKLYQAEENFIIHQEELNESKTQSQIEIQRLKDECKELNQEISSLKSQVNENRTIYTEKDLSEIITERNDIKRQLDLIEFQKSTNFCSFQSLMNENSIMSEKKDSKIKVFVRVRPMLGEAKTPGLVIEKQQLFVCTKAAKTQKSFTFDQIFAENAGIKEIFAEYLPNFSKLSKGGRVCILAYGQTGSGKTFTINSLIVESLRYVSTLLNFDDVTASLQCIEIYNDQIKNLLHNEAIIKNYQENTKITDIKFDND